MIVVIVSVVMQDTVKMVAMGRAFCQHKVEVRSLPSTHECTQTRHTHRLLCPRGINDARLTSDVCLSRSSGLSREQRGLGRLKLEQR